MTQESKRKLMNRLSMGLLYLFLILLIGAFSLNIITNAQMFLQDVNRMAEHAMLDIQGELNKTASDFITDFDKYKKLCEQTRTVEGYEELTKQLTDLAEQDDFLGFTLKTIEGDRDTAKNKFYESFNEEYMQNAISNNRAMYYVHWNKAAIAMCISYYCPISNGNGINLISGIKKLDSLIYKEPLKEILSKYDATLYIADNGANPPNGYMQIVSNRFEHILGNPFPNFGQTYSNDEIRCLEELKKTGKGAVTLSENNNTYLMTKSTFGGYNSSDLYLKTAESFLLFESRNGLGGVIFSLSVLLIAFLAVIITLIIKWRKSENSKKAKDDKVSLLNCSSYIKFSKDSEEFILNNRNVYYAIVNLSITNMKYITDLFGEAMSENFKRYCSDVIASVIGPGETYGALQNETFVLLIRYELKPECVTKMALVREIINKYDFFKDSHISAQFCIGIYYIEPTEKVNIEQFVERANIAMLANKQNPSKTFNEYNNEIHEEFQIQAKIESKMEGALENEDFHVFFQPKYNVARDCIDGAETLVRWYDRKRDGFISPTKFVKLFEANGFINKLDRFVFVKACELLDSAVKSGLRVTPISVNVSRVTAIQKDFISFYKSVKEKYNVPDKYITIEFTESFSFTNMEVLRKIVENLHHCGFLCSVDDFGAGYSSAGLLKDLPMDELKLDMFLLQNEGNEERGEKLIQSIIGLGKAFGMKVTQEGVETTKQFNKLVEFGCDSIQGFLYSKPLVAEDFLKFINSPNSMRAAMENSNKNIYKPVKYINFTQDKDDL